jgi:hypothetical protein
LAAVAFGLDGLNGSRGVSDPIRQAEASPAAESTAQAESPLGWIVRLRYPSSWSELSADDHVAIRDPASGGVFLAGIDALDGPNSSADRFVARWAGTTAASYGVVRVTDATPQQSGSTLYSLEAALEADASRDAMVLVTAYSESEQTLFRWWAALGITEENAPTMRGIAESVEARETSDALSQQER